MEKFKIQKNTIFYLLLFISNIIFINAQSVSGTVLSFDDDSPLPNVSVVEKGTENGTITDFDGKFSIKVKQNAILVFSYISMKTKEVVVRGNVINVELEEDGTLLDEVVIVGYGSVKKSDLTGTVAKVDLEKALGVPTANLAEQLRGRVAGVKVTVGSNRPGGGSNINFRGSRSIIGSNSPIYIIDGVETDGINNINPDDIESVEMLKDASSQAIYGSKASNGVILVTTKQGKSKKIQISYHGYTTISSIKKNFDVYSGQEYAQLRREAYRADNNDIYQPDNLVFPIPEELEALNNNEFVDWEDLLLQHGTISNNSLSISGGTETTKVFGSLSYFNNTGIIPTSAYQRKLFRLNLSQKISEKISADFNISINTTGQDRESQSYNVITLSPIGNSHDDEGGLIRYPDGNDVYTNPLWNIRESNHDIKTNKYSFNFVPKYEITDDLTYKLRVNLTKRNTNNGKYLSSLHSLGKADSGIATIGSELKETYVIENILTYDKLLGDNHKINVTAVQAMDDSKEEGTYTTGKGFSNEDNGYDGIYSATNGVRVSRFVNKFSTASFMGRLRYSFLNKYLLTATYRSDGSSVNKKGNKWVNTTAFAFAWKAHEESFLENIVQIDELKFRASYGALPNQAKIALSTLAAADPLLYSFGGEPISGFSPGRQLVSDNLNHEITKGVNFGVDFRFFNNTIEGNFNYYKTNTTDLILYRTVPSITGFDYTIYNGGESQNSGIELKLTTNIFQKENFSWSITGIYAHNRNELVDLYAKDENGNPINDTSRGYIVGEAINSLQHYVFDGIWQEGEDYENSPQGVNGGIGSNQPNLGPGNIRVKDVNGYDDDGELTGNPDGKIDTADRVYKDRNPKWFGSLSTNIRYKNIELAADFYTVQGVTRRNPYLSDFNSGGTLQGVLNGIKVPYYTPENPSTTFPRPHSEISLVDPYMSSLAYKDASYVRLRTLSLSYALNSLKVSNSKNIDLKIYVTGTNLFTITDYKGYSPEVNANGYPDSKSYTIGLRVKL